MKGNNLNFQKMDIEGVWLAEGLSISDERGSFREWFKTDEIFEHTGINFSTKQANLSISNRGVVRGIHYSIAPSGQAKWITCVTGSIVDVIVDIRPNSQTYGKHVAIKLEASNACAVLIGVGLGHGFISLEDNTCVSYLLSSPYSPKNEFEINPCDPELNIDWHAESQSFSDFIMSQKDLNAPTLAERARSGLLPFK